MGLSSNHRASTESGMLTPSERSWTSERDLTELQSVLQGLSEKDESETSLRRKGEAEQAGAVL